MDVTGPSRFWDICSCHSFGILIASVVSFIACDGGDSQNLWLPPTPKVLSSVITVTTSMATISEAKMTACQLHNPFSLLFVFFAALGLHCGMQAFSSYSTWASLA